MSDILRIANCSGFYGDRISAAREMVEGGPIDVLTGDYLAELTMALLWRGRSKDPTKGYASTFLRQLEEVLGTCVERGIKVVANAGGLNPAGLAAEVERLAERLGVTVTVGYVDGDDILDRLDALQAAGHSLDHLDTGVPLASSGRPPVTANAYLGGFGIARALDLGADVVITGRVTDAALVIGPAARHFGWAQDDWDPLAGALIAGHIIECGAQTTGGNFSFFQEVPGFDHLGFPLVEMRGDGSFVVTKHPGTGGLVSVETVTAQLLYESDGPRYRNPDVTARFDSIRLDQVGPDRVEVTGVKGEPPPPDVKVALNQMGGYRNSLTFVLTGLDIEEKASAVESALWASVGGRDRYAESDVRLIRWDRPDPGSNEEAMAHLRITVKDPDPRLVGRAFSGAGVELVLASYPGFFLTTPPRDGSPYAVYWPTTVPAGLVPHRAHVGDVVEEIAPVVSEPRSADVTPAVPAERKPVGFRRGALGAVAGARSGDKGGNANVGVWVRDPGDYAWLEGELTVDRFRRLVPEAAGLVVDRYELPNLGALNFVVRGLLGEGVSSSTATDPQAKSLGEYLRARLVDLPVHEDAPG